MHIRMYICSVFSTDKPQPVTGHSNPKVDTVEMGDGENGIVGDGNIGNDDNPGPQTDDDNGVDHHGDTTGERTEPEGQDEHQNGNFGFPTATTGTTATQLVPVSMYVPPVCGVYKGIGNVIVYNIILCECTHVYTYMYINT